MTNAIVFVGIHYKTGFQALDSQTKSGQIIDRISSRFDCRIIKTNIFPTDHLPPESEQKKYAKQFRMDQDKIYIALGKTVQKYISGMNVIYTHHPGYAIRKGTEGINEFVANVSKGIQILINLRDQTK